MGNAIFVDVQTSPAIMGDGGLYLRSISHVHAVMHGALLQTGQDRQKTEEDAAPLGPPPPRRGGVEVERADHTRVMIHIIYIRPLSGL